MSELLRKAEQSIDSLAAKLRTADGIGRPEGAVPNRHSLAAALSGSCLDRAPPGVPMEELINAARSSVEQVADGSRGEAPAVILQQAFGSLRKEGQYLRAARPCTAQLLLSQCCAPASTV